MPTTDDLPPRPASTPAMLDLVERFDWAATSLGPMTGWPASQRALVSFVLHAPVAIASRWGTEGVMIYNDAYSVIAGDKHPQILGMPVAEAWPELAEFNMAVLARVLAGETVSYADQKLVLQRGGIAQTTWFNLDYSPAYGDDGAPIGEIAVVVETTARVLAEQAARENSHVFSALAQALPNQVWIAPGNGALNWFNDLVYEYAGAQRGEFDGGGWAAMVHADDLAGTVAAWDAARASGMPYEREFRLRRADGVYRWHIARALPVKDDKGVVQRWVGTNTDIEDQKLAALLLANMNDMLSNEVRRRTAERDGMWELSTDLMLVADFQATIEAVNPAFTALLGWRAAEVTGNSFMQLVHPDDVASTLAEVAGLASGKTTFKFENRYRHHDGSYRTISWAASPDQHHIHAVGRDVTAEREAAAAMRRTEQALQQSQKMETIGKLTGGVAHDFNNLLQVISGNLQLLLSDVSTNPRALKRVENAIDGVARGAKLASQLLAFGRRQALAPRVVKLSRYVAGMDDMLHRSIGEAIELETVISAGLWNVLADTAQVENAILNLCINARDAMDGVGRLTIEVCNATLDEAYAGAHEDVAAGQYVMIAVSDTGAGMAPEVLQQAFEPFFSTKPEGKGTGLGLSMVYGFVKQSGGHIKIYSEVGNGTSVKIYLPRSYEAEESEVLATVQPITGGSETILVAEDDDEVRNTVVELLGELGYRVLKASDAASALAIVSSGMPIDLLFTDVVMPGPLRSPDLARKARELLPALAVLFTSGYTENAIVHGGRLDAGVDLLGKPYTRAALAQKIRQVLSQQKARMALAAGDNGAPNARTVALRIMLVEDDAPLRQMTAEMLEHFGYEVAQASDGETALEQLAGERKAADVLITDLELPGMCGEMLATRARQLRPGMGIVFASGRGGSLEFKDAVQLLKPYDMEALKAAVQKALRA